MDEKINPLVEMKTQSVKLEELESEVKEIALRLGRIGRNQEQAEANLIADSMRRLAGRLDTTD